MKGLFMSQKLRELQNKKLKAVEDARAILNSAKDGVMTAEESTNYEKAFKESQDIEASIKAEQQLQKEERAIAEAVANTPAPTDKVNEPMSQMTAFGQILAYGINNASPEARDIVNALQKDSDPAGGFTVPPEQFVAQLIKAVDDQTFIRAKATKTTVNTADSLGIPSLDNDPADADWTSEIKTGSEDSTMSFGKRNLAPNPLAKRIKVSNTLLRISALPIENIVIDRLAYKFGITEEKAFLTGTGASQPLGLFTASADGISTGRDVSTDNTTTAMTADGLREVKYTLKGNYWTEAEWLFHRDAVKQISKLKDGQGQYLWQPGLRAGDPDTLLGFPINMSEYAPNTFTTGLYVGMLGAYKHYWIADALNMGIQRLNELYAETNQVGFIGRMELDGMPVLEEAFVRVKLA
jgi:HK97 family phage major capsid protein